VDARLEATGLPPLADHERANWAKVQYPPVKFDEIVYYSAPKNEPKYQSWDEVDPKLLETYEKLGIPLHERAALAGVAVDAVFDSVSVATTFKDKLEEAGHYLLPVLRSRSAASRN
jgi:Fe-S cluster assembly protein SufB